MGSMQLNSILIILAGGESSRMGVPKGLLEYNDIYWVVEQLNRAVDIQFKIVLLVLGNDYQQYFKKLPFLRNALNYFMNYKNLKLKVVINDKPQLGTFSSIVTALNQIKTKDDVFVLPIDVPLISVGEIQKLHKVDSLVTIPSCKNKGGHPVKLQYEFWDKLRQINLESNEARLDYQIKKIDKKHIELISVSDKNALLNLNTPNEWN
ncbi:MAG: NTP transferase domain-containing protein, partial [Flavobacteriaceae bacterium]|nr:NTP transferase domain-containing protein [Flavobacteriaceae bacterium]